MIYCPALLLKALLSPAGEGLCAVVARAWGSRDSCWPRTLPFPWLEAPAAKLRFGVHVVVFWGPRAVFL